MLLFCDGFESFDVFDLWRKWGFVKFGKTIADGTSMYMNAEAKIVSGMDTTVNPPQPRARHQRALAFKNHIILGTPFEKSRTVHTGFAFRTRTASSVRLRFLANLPTFRFNTNRGFNLESLFYKPSHGSNAAHCFNTVAVCDISIKSDRVDCVWFFYDNSLPKQYTQVTSNTNLLSGDWYYYQAGFSILGSDVNNPQGWVENRIGNRVNKRNRIENIRTTVSNGKNSYYVNGISMEFDNGAGGAWSDIDDVYITNDDGNSNNGFLGNISIRAVHPVAEGSVNQGVPVGGNTMYRMEHVGYGDDGIVRTVPYSANIPVVDGEPLTVGEDPRQSYLRLAERDAQQLIRFTHTNFAGAEPNIVGIALSVMARSGHAVGTASQLRPIVRVGDAAYYGRNMPYPPLPRNTVCGELSVSDQYSYLADAHPVTSRFYAEDMADYGFHFIQTFFEPDDNNFTLWNTVAVNNSDYGFILTDWTGDTRDFSISATRRNVTFNDTISDSFSFDEYTSRHIEILMTETFEVSVPSAYSDWGAVSDDSFVVDDASEPARGFQFFAEEFLYSKDEFRMDFVSLEEFVGLADSLDFSWHAGVEEVISLTCWNTTWLCEEVTTSCVLGDSNVGSVAALVAETFQLDSSDIWDNHLDVGEDIFINVSYIFSGHELANEYLELESYAQTGVGIDVNDEIVFTEYHHDAWWVELFSDSAGYVDDVKTQQWRHLWFMGVIIQSWQIGDIEQPGMTDGNRVGDLDSDIFG